MKKVFLFPGQGSQYPGMAKKLFMKYDYAKKIIEHSNNILEYDIKDILINESNELINKTKYTQPAIFIHSMIVDHLLKENGYTPVSCAGHSLGEYSALVSLGIINFDKALHTIKHRANKMDSLGKTNPGKMAAIINTDIPTISKILKSYNNIVIANYNTEDQVIISGDKFNINTLINKSKEHGLRRIIPLNVSGAFHSPLMKKARKYLEKFIKSIEFHDTKRPIYQNVYPRKNFVSTKIKNNITNQIDQPVQWLDTINNMKKDGYTEFIEVGPKNILTNFNKKIVPELNTINSETLI